MVDPVTDALRQARAWWRHAAVGYGACPGPRRSAAAALGILLVLAMLAACGASASETDTQRIELAGERFELELALTPEARHQGLSDRASIDERGGMLFVFPEPRRLTFVMRRCLVPIDLIYLDASGRVVNTHAMTVEPYDTPDAELKPYASRYPAQFAIELRGGWLEELDLEAGDKVELPRDRLKAAAR